MTRPPAPPLTDEEQRRVDVFEAAQYPPEVEMLRGHEPWCGWQQHELNRPSSCACGYLGRTLRALEANR